METRKNQRAYDSAERQAHQFKDNVHGHPDPDPVMKTHSRSPEPVMGQPISSTKRQAPPEFLIVAHIKAGMKPDGAFKAESTDGAQIMLHMDENENLVLSVDEDDGTMRTWVIKCK